MKTFSKTKKQHYVKKMEAHAAADEIIQGSYWENGKGCHVGCLVDVKKDAWHEELEKETGIPQALGYLFDRIFEGLPNGDAKLFARDTIKMVPPNTDLSNVVSKFLVWLMKDLQKYTKPRSDQRKALQNVRKLYERRLAGETVSDSEFAYAADAARAAYKKMAKKLHQLLKEAA
jgi:hypothetical protein